MPFDALDHRASHRSAGSASIAVIPVVPVQVRRRASSCSTAGQNIAGFVRLRVRGRRGDRVTVRHAEVLEPDGSLHTRALRSARATDTYVLADDESDRSWSPCSRSMAFNTRRSRPTRTSSTRSSWPSAATPRGEAPSSAPTRDLNRLHENVVWSQRDNFVSVPTDCPQRDERLGWTGDAQAFAPTACTLFDSQSFWASWLRDLALEQDDVLGVPSRRPGRRHLRRRAVRASRTGPTRPRSCRGPCTSPTATSVLVRPVLDSMRRWIARSCVAAGRTACSADSQPVRRLARPGRARRIGPGRPRPTPTYLANAFFAHSARLAADAARSSGRPRSRPSYRALADASRSRRGRAGREHADHDSDRLRCGAPVRDSSRTMSGRASATRSPRSSEPRTGGSRPASSARRWCFPALADDGHLDEAYLMLLRREMPSWLYQVDSGCHDGMGALGRHPARRLASIRAP